MLKFILYPVMIVRKSIPIINSEGEPVLPHYQYQNFDDIVSCATHIKKKQNDFKAF